MNEKAPRALEDVLAPAWLSDALGEPIDSVSVVETLHTTATKVRFVARRADGTEARYCIKGMFSAGPLHPGHARISQDESRFYRDVAPNTAVNIPTCRYTGIDEATGHGLIIMDDVVADGGRFLTALEPYSADQARASLEQLAALHAEHWAGSGLAGKRWVRSRLADLVGEPLQPTAALQLLLDDERSEPLEAAVLDAARISGALAALSARTAEHPTTLVHGDAHAGNLYVQSDGAIALIDWQLVQSGGWALDVAYHVGAVLTVEDRRLRERELLAYYLDCLAANGVVRPPGADEAWQAYRASMSYGFYLWANTRRVDRAIINEFCKRLGTALTDLESLELLGL